MKEIRIGKSGKVALVDDEDYEYLSKFKWHLSASGKGTHIYVCSRKVKKGVVIRHKMHRLIMKAPDGMVVDHIDHDCLNNQKSNLRVCTHKDNAHNYQKRRGGSSKYLGVMIEASKRKNGKIDKYIRSVIRIDGKKIDLGFFKNEEDAAKAHDIAALKFRGSYASLNFPELKPIYKTVQRLSKLVEAKTQQAEIWV